MTAKLSSTDPHTAYDLGLIADTDLAKLDPGLEYRRQILYQLTEIDPSVCGKIEKYFIVIKRVLCINELHLQLMLVDLFQTDTKSFFFLLLISLGSGMVIRIGDPDHRL